MRKIVQITYTGFGGLGSVVFSFIGADRDFRYEHLVGFIGDESLDPTYPTLCLRHGVRYNVFRSTPGRPFGAWSELIRWLDKVQPDAIICHSITAILACRWYGWKRKKPVIAVEHTSNQVKTRNEWAASWVCMLVADRVVLLTEEYQYELRNAHGWIFRTKKVRVIPNGIDTELFRPASQGLAKKALIRIGMAARFSFSKRQDLLVKTFARLVDLRPDLAFELHFAGDGSEFARVRSLAIGSNFSEQIHFDGLLNENQVAEWLRNLDIYVHATEGEILSTSLLQAMSTGLPIVASAIPGVTNLLGKTDEFGLCVANDADAFAQSILRIVESAELGHALAGRARSQVLARYSNQVMLRAYLDLIAACH